MRILRQLKIQEISINGLSRREGNLGKDKDFWQPPPEGYLKCNPAIAEYKGVLRDENGSIRLIFHCQLGKTTNNMAKLMTLEQCLELLNLNQSSNVIIEADSEISINVVKRISCGVAPKKVSNHLRLIQVYQRIQKHLLSLRTVSFRHVRREATKLAYTLANQGVMNSKSRFEMK